MSALPRLFVLDTTVASQLTATRPDPAVTAWLDAAPPRTLCLPAGAVYELQLGVELARRNGNTRAADFERRLDVLLRNRRYRILPVDGQTARIRAALAADPDLRHLALPNLWSRRPQPSERLAIAAAALSIGAAVATLDRRAFAQIGRCRPSLDVFDPSTGSWAAALDPAPSERPSRRRARRVGVTARGAPCPMAASTVP
ncbi:PIN domain-containing protein [Mangrovicella endophytica]|uniref:PIN domain-containing protein n=1 Tax=Mangrovicella endophytica TaxID=2066697 RepID=UPI000C9E8597|nr:PIN domain-containing protein [Mangrovicella endophytica]